ncbi:MAG: HNH endonuclease [Chitinophagales bacterium]|nr:HNH endonuclease [Bacteroidota bacterium]MCB9033387.1 HNH endonuclease [Chitinophagales bacterium]
MIFTINLSRHKDESSQLSLTSKLTFTQQLDGHKDLAISHRKLKQYLFAEILNNLGYDITDNNDILFGIFDLKTNEFLTTSAEKFLNDFLVVSILKGHFMANKGYEIELFPSFKNISSEFKSLETNIETTKELPSVIKDQRAKRAIPLSLRFKVLHRDKSTCLICGKTPKDGIKLHIDHITPHSKGGLTVFNNLRTLCNECNIGRSNKYAD